MIIKTPPIESELFPTWEKHIEENPGLKNSPAVVKENFEQSIDELYATIIFLSSF